MPHPLQRAANGCTPEAWQPRRTAGTHTRNGGSESSPTALIVEAGSAVFAIVVAIIVFRSTWRVPEPDEAILVSGHKNKIEGVNEGLGFRIVTGRGTFVLPGVQTTRRLKLDLNETPLSVDCVTNQGIPVHGEGHGGVQDR